MEEHRYALSPIDPASGAFEPERYLRPVRDDQTLAGLLGLQLAWEPAPWLFTRIRLDSGLIRYSALTGEVTSGGLPVEEELSGSLGLREALIWLGLGGRDPWLTLTSGRLLHTVGQGLVHAERGLAAGLHLNGEPWTALPLHLRADLILPRSDLSGEGVHSPLGLLRLSWEPTFLESFTLFGALFRDRDDNLAAIEQAMLFELVALDPCLNGAGECPQPLLSRYRANLAQAELHSTGRMSWLGAEFSLYLGAAHLIRGALIRGQGQGTLTTHYPEEQLLADGAADLQLGGWAAALSWEWHLGSWMPSVYAYSFGGAAPELQRSEEAGRFEVTHAAFPTLVPWLEHARLFHDCSLSEGYVARQASLPGVSGRGVLAAGAGLDWDPGPGWSTALEATLLLAQADGPLPDSGRWYGVETDLELHWRAWSGLEFLLQAELFLPGDFFVERTLGARIQLATLGRWP